MSVNLPHRYVLNLAASPMRPTVGFEVRGSSKNEAGSVGSPPFSVTQLRIRNGSSCPKGDLCPGPYGSIGQAGKQSFDRAAGFLSHDGTTAKSRSSASGSSATRMLTFMLPPQPSPKCTRGRRIVNSVNSPNRLSTVPRRSASHSAPHRCRAARKTRRAAGSPSTKPRYAPACAAEPRLVFSDGAPVMIRAVEEYRPCTQHQRSVAHKVRNLRSRIPEGLWPDFKARAVRLLPSGLTGTSVKDSHSFSSCWA
jgi:hypothetical protein